MKKIGEYHHNELGTILCCESDPEYKENYWGKKQKLKLFSKQQENIHILFDLYNYDSHFNIVKEEMKEKTLQEEKKIVENYKLFLNSFDEIENYCLAAYQSGNQYFSEYHHIVLDYFLPNLPEVKNLEELYKYIRVGQVYISSHCYEVRLQFLYSMADICIYGYINDDKQTEMGIKSGLDTFQVNPVIGTKFEPPYAE